MKFNSLNFIRQPIKEQVVILWQFSEFPGAEHYKFVKLTLIIWNSINIRVPGMTSS